jgi:predicted dehydrogenase
VISVGLVGAGPWAAMFTAPLLTSARDLALTGVWARRKVAAQELARAYRAAAVDSFDELLAGCDAVVFAVPPDVQAPLAVAAARAGKHLLLEKPVAFTVADAQEVAAAADTAGVATQLMLTYRYTAQVRSFLASIAGTQIAYIRAAFVGGGALDGSPFATPWRQVARAALFDLAPHTMDLAEAVAGPITELRAAELDGVLTVTTAHDGGAVGHVVMSGTTPGAAGVLEAEAISAAGRVVLADPTPYQPGEVHRVIAEEFAGTVRGELSQPLDVHRGVRLQQLIAAVAVSIDSGRAVPP